MASFERAGDEARTRDLFLGKEVFYQLNYARERFRLYVILGYCQPPYVVF